MGRCRYLPRPFQRYRIFRCFRLRNARWIDRIKTDVASRHWTAHASPLDFPVMSRLSLLVAMSLMVGCGSVDASSVEAPLSTGGASASTGGAAGTGGGRVSVATGGKPAVSVGGATSTGGASGTGGLSASSGGAETGGAIAAGGFAPSTGGSSSIGGHSAGGAIATGGAPAGGRTAVGGAGGAVASGGAVSAGGGYQAGGTTAAAGGSASVGTGGYGGLYGWGNSCRPIVLTQELVWSSSSCNELRPCVWACDGRDIPLHAACFKTSAYKFQDASFCCTDHEPNKEILTCIPGQ